MKASNIYDVLVIVVYFLFMLVIGALFLRRNRGGKEYFTGGNRIPWWMSGMTLYMANFSAWTFTGAAGFAYSTGWFTILYFAAGPIAYLVGTQLTAAKWRRTRSISPVEYTYSRYNVTTQQIIGWVISINFILSAGVQLASTCKILAPILGFDILPTIIVTGIIILLYSFLGGIWAVSLTDVVQGIILLSITFIVMPLSVSLVGVDRLAQSLSTISFDHTYNGVHYTAHWLVSILLIMTIGFAGGQGQRFYSVRDEKAALRVGRFAGVLAITIPVVFGIPPIVAKLLWPDLSQIEWFRQNGGANPQDMVFVALCLKLLPNGLIGIFVAAMLAATMSTLSAVYNMVSSVFSRDIYSSIFRRELNDRALLVAGRISTAALGLIVLGLALVFVNNKFGIFNQMQAFFTLFNIPITVPLAFGLLNRRVPRWSAVGAIVWGLLAGSITRYVLGWDIGPQVYFALFMTTAIYLSSRSLGRVHRTRHSLLYPIGLIVGVAVWAFFRATTTPDAMVYHAYLAAAGAFAFGISIPLLSRLFARETEADVAGLRAFFAKLDTPVDVAAEVAEPEQAGFAPSVIAGGTTVTMGLLMALIHLADLSSTERVIVSVLIAVMIAVGTALIFGGRKHANSATE
jgi:solute:Na+ symporter, SSS family